MVSCARKISDQIEKVVPKDLLESENLRFEKLATQTPSEILYQGSNWGALEQMRREKSVEKIPAGFIFESARNVQISEWIELLETGNFPDSEVNETPSSWMVQKNGFHF